ncbi:MAG: tetratricopeptide repeat protein, partial [Gammaproteobacteria bacterium]
MDLKSAEQAAGELFAQGRFQKAATIYQQMKRLLPERLDLQSRLGYLALLANDLDAAIDQLSKAINQGLRSRQT